MITFDDLPASKYVVLNENTLGYRIQSMPNWIGVLHGRVLGGNPGWSEWSHGMVPILPPLDVVREATLADFEEYRVMAPLAMRQPEITTNVR